MKKKAKAKKIYSFSSLSTPDEFISRLSETAVQAKLGIEQTENGFDLDLEESNHGGRVVYHASVSTSASGGSVIQGTIETIPWHTRPARKKTILDKILTIICYILVIPIVLIALIVAAITALVIWIIHGKSEEVNEKEILCDFMTNKMCCTRENDK